MALTPVELGALSVQARQMLGAAQAAQVPHVPGVSAPVPGAAASFSGLVSQGLSRVNDQLVTGQQALQRLAMGDTGNLHQAMTRLEESRISFQLMLQVRSRLLEAYQDLMKMPL